MRTIVWCLVELVCVFLLLFYFFVTPLMRYEGISVPTSWRDYELVSKKASIVSSLFDIRSDRLYYHPQHDH